MTIKKAEKKETVNYTVIEDYPIKERKNGYTLRLRYMQWNDRDAVYDLRPWKTTETGEEVCGKGLTISGEELEELVAIVKA